MARVAIKGKYFWFYILLFLVIFLAAVFVNDLISPRLNIFPRFNQSTSFLTVGGQRLWFEVADSSSERAKGLSGRSSMASDWGMLFIFPQPGRHSFWMNQMKFELDFVFINDQAVLILTDR